MDGVVGKNSLFADCLPEFLPKIRAIALSYKAGEYTEDLVQEGLTALYLATLHFDENRGVPFSGFAFTCIKNAMISALRKQSKENNLLCDFSDSSNMVSTIPGPDELALMTEDFQSIKTNIGNNLSSLEYRVLTLYLQGLSYSQIAAELEKSEKSVDNALSRIKKKLSHLL